MATYEDFQKLDLRIAEVKGVREHPNADRLLLLDILIGEKERQIVAGIRASYSRDDLVGKKIVVIENLEPLVIRGEESHGMLLAASSEAGPVVLIPEKDVPSGSQVK